MSNHTPINQTQEDYKETLARHITCALRLYDKKESVELDVYRQSNYPLIDKLADGWLWCKCDTIGGYGRSLAYAAIGKKYEGDRFNEIGELHYGSIIQRNGSEIRFQDYWDGLARYITKSLSGLI